MALRLGACASYNVSPFDSIVYETVASELANRNSLWKFRIERPVRTGEIYKQLFTLKTHQIKHLSFHNTPEKFDNSTIIGHLEFVFEKISVGEIKDYSWRYCFRKALFSKSFSPILNRRLQIPPVWRAFSKSFIFVTDSVWTVGLTVEIKLRFHISLAFSTLIGKGLLLAKEMFLLSREVRILLRKRWCAKMSQQFFPWL